MGANSHRSGVPAIRRERLVWALVGGCLGVVASVVAVAFAGGAADGLVEILSTVATVGVGGFIGHATARATQERDLVASSQRMNAELAEQRRAVRMTAYEKLFGAYEGYRRAAAAYAAGLAASNIANPGGPTDEKVREALGQLGVVDREFVTARLVVLALEPFAAIRDLVVALRHDRDDKALAAEAMAFLGSDAEERAKASVLVFQARNAELKVLDAVMSRLIDTLNKEAQRLPT